MYEELMVECPNCHKRMLPKLKEGATGVCCQHCQVIVDRDGKIESVYTPKLDNTSK